MFPLEHAVLPGAVVPLHVFEPRYRALVTEVTGRDEPEFGVAMIERGREVGGGDQRSDVGVVARVLDAEEFPDGRWAIAAVGTRRIRVEEWRPDDPYPRALVDDWPDEASDVDAGELDLLLTDVGRILSAARRLAPEHHLPDPAFRRDDPSSTLWQAIGFAGLGPLDNQKLLREAGSPERLGLARHLIAERADVLEALLG